MDVSTSSPIFSFMAAVSENPYPPEEGSQCYFRCPKLEATLSLRQCRINRYKHPLHNMLMADLDPMLLEADEEGGGAREPGIAAGFDLYLSQPWDAQPYSCWSCDLALAVESGAVPFYPANEVLSGRARLGAPPSNPVWPGSHWPGFRATG